ncbi:response regulator transcription factor [Streptomyces spectabilis]|uniref:DNA-binding response regulator n=1 Tax=Streptomyces spectabilis TaxID=68270 RepID=A0A5P2XI48_STRST|nr:response regulator transcription factor [Streptomyces spectabilis]MBB5102479.1 two-component system response regulator MprA [Streptomyces spectabilis]MCI3907520.1 response regulator transcription factor [Streptomyces spectabilis]QEV64211.1 DNA-binding response regulator [Streptomyces spectabilis]GGV31616.1 response regulator MprA [Streptomyces spectabilis]
MTEATEHRRTVLVVEDDPGVRSTLDQLLRFEGYRVLPAPDGLRGLALIEEEGPDLAVVDVVMPGLDGLALCRMLRRRGDRLPVLVLTARDQIGDRVAGLDAGADDYLAKPFATEELLARIRALLRRTDPPAAAAELLAVGDLTLDPATRQAHRGPHPLDLTKTEFDVLELLLNNPGVVLTRTQIYERIWGYDFDTTSRSLDVYIGYLRRKTERDGAPRVIHTVRNVGYTVRSA